jgi:phospholipase C
MAEITNVVVLMLENRSFDNVLGALGPARGGLEGTETNPDPSGGDPIQVHSTFQPVTIGTAGAAYAPTCLPLVDPGEPFNDMAQQFLSLSSAPVTNPWTSYDPDAPGLMQGFTRNYLTQLMKPSVKAPKNTPDIMNYLTPEQLPVTNFLAQNFGVCCRWFASAPTHTFTNRTFALLAAPAVEKFDLFGAPFSLMDDPQFVADVGLFRRIPSTSIFEQLDNVYPDGKGSADAPNWRVYFHDYPIAMLGDPYTFNIATSAENQNIACFDNTDYGALPPPFLGNVPAATFMSDVQNGLPMFSFIEPRYNMQSSDFSGTPGDLLPNCAHPGFGNLISLSPSSRAVNVPSDAASAELLIMRIYNMLQASPNWATTLFIVTYDEPGGTYDHVAPPLATPPGSGFPAASDLLDPAADGFEWNVFGGRVPAIIVSPTIAHSSLIDNATFDHTSIIRTVWNAFGLTQGSTTSLTQRDAAAPDLLQFCNATNSTGPYTGTIICAPSALVFSGEATLMFYASAGDATELTAAINGQPSWITLSTEWDALTNELTVAVTVNPSGVSGIVSTTMMISPATASSDGPEPVPVPITLSAS